MNLAFNDPIIFWNCACLISDAGGDDETEDDEEAIEELKHEEIYSNEMEEFNEDEDEEEDSYEEEDCDGYPAEVIKTKEGKKKKKVKATNYGKIAAAIGKIKSEGVQVFAPDINDSTFTFSPDVEENAILFGLSGITRIGKELIQTIMANRPYSSIEDFLSKVKVNKPQMINLIKSGAFDCFGSRFDVMHHYIELISEPKKRMTLQNMKMLIDFGLIPDEYDLQRRTFNFNKYAKKNLKIDEVYYKIDEPAYRFFETYFSIDKFEPCEDSPTGFKIKQSSWKSIYDTQMDKIRPFVKNHNQELLNAVNQRLVDDLWEKYCLGTISKWEMDSISCYEHDHELAHVAPYYDFVDFNKLDEEPVVDQILTFKGKRIPIFKLSRIAGTVLDRDKNKKTVTLLTTTGVVPVKIYSNAFANYDKQLSEKGPDGKKHVIEKSWFSRGNKIIVTGIRNGNMFMAKKYKRTPYHLVEKIEQVNDDGSLVITHGREIE